MKTLFSNLRTASPFGLAAVVACVAASNWASAQTNDQLRQQFKKTAVELAEMAWNTSCIADINSICEDVKVGRGKAYRCLVRNKAKLTEECRKTLPLAKALVDKMAQIRAKLSRSGSKPADATPKPKYSAKVPKFVTTPDKVKSGSIEYKIAVQRATQAAIWAMPAAGMIDFEKATKRDLGGDVNDVIYVSKPFVSRHGFLTANDVTPYAWASISTERGPLVVEVPAATDKVGYFGTIVNAWDVPLIDVGTTGTDKGKGGKYLIMPPGDKREAPKGYIVVQSDTINQGFSFRPVMKKGATFKDTTAYAKKLQIYYLADAASPPPTKHIDAFPKKYGSLPTYDMSFFQDIYDVINREPTRPQDKAMMGVLAGIGIEKGKPFKPTADQRRAMEEGIKLAYASMQSYFVTEGKAMVPWWKDKKWYIWDFAEGQAEAGFPYVTDDKILIDERAGGSYFWITYLPKKLGGGTFYLTGLRDSDGNLLDGKSTYKLRVPNDTPAKDFWSAIVYSMETKGFLVGAKPVGISSRDKDTLKFNKDGSVDIYFAPKAPKGLESNWVPTGEDFFLLFRLYGPDKPLFDKSWVLADIEKVK